MHEIDTHEGVCLLKEKNGYRSMLYKTKKVKNGESMEKNKPYHRKTGYTRTSVQTWCCKSE
jgi:hypothetical protein